MLGSLSFSSCMEDFSDVNTDPSIITTPDIRYLFTQGLNDFIPSDYWSWYYDFTNMLHWGQVTVSGNTNLLNQPANSSGIGNVVRILKVMREIDYQVESMTDPVKAAQYKHIQSMMKTLVVFMGIQDTDMYGSMPYSEAAMARYTTPALLTPKYDTQEELFTSFDEEKARSIIDEALKTAETKKRPSRSARPLPRERSQRASPRWYSTAAAMSIRAE